MGSHYRQYTALVAAVTLTERLLRCFISSTMQKYLNSYHGFSLPSIHSLSYCSNTNRALAK